MRKYIVPSLLVICMLLVAFWLVAGRLSDKPFKAFNLTGAEFAGFTPTVAGMTLRAVPVAVRDEAEPNVAAYLAECEGSPLGFGFRLVHGYNMPMCMKIKGYRVEEVAKFPSSQVAKEIAPSNSTTQQLNNLVPRGLPIQIWRVISSTGDTSIWVTTMIRSGDFAVTPVDVCSMAFPRVDIPDDPNWVPQGFQLADLKHPLQSARLYLRARWNASRTDPLTFLRLRQPAWANEELLTYVSRSLALPVTPENEAMVVRRVVASHAAVLKELQQWRGASTKGTTHE
ncbi:MAG: hypothetical protein WCS52_14660 [bacterium]